MSDPPPQDPLRRWRRAVEGVLGVAATEGNRIDILRNGDRIFPAMLEAAEGATSTIDFLTFIYWEGEIGTQFAECFAERARAGVRVRVLLDAMGAREIEPRLVTLMKEAGCQVEWFRPVTNLKIWEANHRTHRKVLICDEDVAFTGGVGIADEWRGDARNEHEWRDTHFRIRGPAVDGLRSAFIDNWVETGRPAFEIDVDRFPEQPKEGDSVVQVVRGAAETGWSDVTTLVRTLLTMARDRVRITTAYFAPDDTTLGLMCETAQRGVDVHVLLPGPFADKRFCQLASEASYERLLDAGVRVSSFQPTMLHAKIMTVDGLVANVGSSNFNARSLGLDEEVNLVVLDPDCVAVLDEHFEEDVRRAEPIDPERWKRRSPIQKVGEAVVSVFDGHT